MDLSVAEMIAWYVVFLFSTTLHEAAHAWAAKKGGDPTAYHGGQVTLNPVPHIKRSPIGMVVLPLIGMVTLGWPIGFASAPYNPQWAYRHPKKAAWMALAGPGSNLLIMLIALLLIHIGIWTGVFTIPSYINMHHIAEAANEGLPVTLALFLSIAFSLNMILFIFNMLPVPPLDGADVIMFFISEAKARRYQEVIHQHQNIAFIGLYVAWKLFTPVFDALYMVIINVIYPGHFYG